MKKRVFMFILALTLALSVCCNGYALTPTPSPVPDELDTCGNHIHLSVSGGQSEPQKHLLYSQESWRTLDGLLMFMPLKEYVDSQQIDVISREQFLTAELTVDGWIKSLSFNTAYFRKTEDGFEGLKSDDVPLTDVPDHTYLIRMDISATGEGNNAIRFDYLFWLR